MKHAYRRACSFCVVAAALCLSGCTSFSDYFHHGFKVGPEYSPAKAAVAPELDRGRRYPRPQPCRRPEPLVVRFQ